MPEECRGGSAANVSACRRREPRAGSAPTTSTSTCCTCPTRRRRSPRRSRRSPSSSTPARCARSAARTSPPQMLDEAASVAAQELGRAAFVNVQNNYSLLDRTRRRRRDPSVRAARHHAHALLPARERRAHRQVQAGRAAPEGTRLAAWGDRGRAMLTDEKHATSSSASRQYAKDHGHTLPELALSWLAGTPDRRERHRGGDAPEQVRANAAATSAWQLTDAGARRGRASSRVRRLTRGARGAHRRRGRRRLASPGPLADVGAPACARARRGARRSRGRSAACAAARRARDGVGVGEPRAAHAAAGSSIRPRSLAAFPAPTVAVWDGPAIGAGAELLLAADVRVVGERATMAFPEVGARRAPVLGRDATAHASGGVCAGAAHARDR